MLGYMCAYGSDLYIECEVIASADLMDEVFDVMDV